MKLRISSKRKAPRRRAGRVWENSPTLVDAAEFSAAQLAALKADPLLEVAELIDKIKSKGE